MNKKFIWGIIILMSVALFGIAVTQFIWIKTQVDLDSKSFGDKTFMALNNVKVRLAKDAKEKNDKKRVLEAMGDQNLFGKQISTIPKLLSPDNKNYFNNKHQFNSIMQNIEDPVYLLENMDIKKLDKYLKDEFKDQGIDIKYDYGVYSNKEKEYIYRNGHYSVPIAGNASKPKGAEKDFNSSPYQVQIYGIDEESPGHLKIFFPGKRSFLWARVLPSLLTSFLFIGLVLFCFAYTIFVIFRQKKVSEMKTDFINNMTHEFKTPIATISLASDSITNSTVIDSPDKIRRFAGIIKQENHRMLNQVEKVLQMAKIDRKDFQLKLTEVNVNDVVYQASEHARLKILKRNGKLDVALNASKPIVEGDLTHISNMIHNLLDNAEKYSNEQPVIKVVTSDASDGINVSISDNGIGMTPESQKHIFDKFYRVHTGNRHDVKGFGLGLSYVKALIDAHQGSIKVSSEIGKGSTFLLFFPFIHSD